MIVWEWVQNQFFDTNRQFEFLNSVSISKFGEKLNG